MSHVVSMDAPLPLIVRTVLPAASCIATCQLPELIIPAVICTEPFPLTVRGV